MNNPFFWWGLLFVSSWNHHARQRRHKHKCAGNIKAWCSRQSCTHVSLWGIAGKRARKVDLPSRDPERFPRRRKLGYFFFFCHFFFSIFSNSLLPRRRQGPANRVGRCSDGIGTERLAVFLVGAVRAQTFARNQGEPRGPEGWSGHLVASWRRGVACVPRDSEASEIGMYWSAYHATWAKRWEGHEIVTTGTSARCRFTRGTPLLRLCNP